MLSVRVIVKRINFNQMNTEHLLKIINNTWLKYSQIDETNEQFKSMFEPVYAVIPFGEQHTHRCLTFEPNNHGLKYKVGSLSCTGLVLNYTHERFKVSVSVFYDYSKREIYNSVLATPKYTEKDWQGRKTIRQSGVRIMSDKDLSNYFKRLLKRFVCPVLA